MSKQELTKPLLSLTELNSQAKTSNENAPSKVIERTFDVTVESLDPSTHSSSSNSDLIYDLDELEKKETMGEPVPYYYMRRYIHFGYRASFNMTMRKATASIFMMHCETSNIWTHLLATIYFIVNLCMILAAAGEWAEQTSAQSKVLSVVSCSSVILCMTISSAFHTYNCMSASWADRLLRADFMSIGLNCITQGTCILFLAYSQWPFYRNLICISLGVIEVVLLAINMMPRFTKRTNEGCKNYLFGSVVLLMVILCMVWMFCLCTDEERERFGSQIGLAIIYLTVGFVFYGSRAPERQAQGNKWVAMIF